MYICVLSNIAKEIPFTPFEGEVLRTINIVPSNIHPNNWAFVMGFEILCGDHGVTPKIGFFLFILWNQKG